MVEWEALRSAGPQTCSPIMEISISCAHIEHLIVGRKPDILLVSAMVLRSQVSYSGYCNMRQRSRLIVQMRGASCERADSEKATCAFLLLLSTLLVEVLW